MSRLTLFVRRLRAQRRSVEPDWPGKGWLVYNLRDFNPARFAQLQDSRAVYSIEMEGFGDTHWFEHGEPSAEYFVSQVPKQIVTKLRRKRCLLLLDMSNESCAVWAVERWIDALHAALLRRKIPLRQCVLLLQNARFGEHYARYCRRKAIHALMSTLYYGYYVRRIVLDTSVALTPELAQAKTTDHIRSLDWLRPKAFLCLNYTPRPIRVGLLSWLMGAGLADRGIISFRGFGDRKDGLAVEEAIPEWFARKAVADLGLLQLRAAGPMTIDLAPNHHAAVPLGMDWLPAYDQTYFSIVTETDYSDGDMCGMTEKIMKPILAFHPFVVCGNPRTLAMLRDVYGFETFAPLIDERYDEETDPTKRLDMIMTEIERLSSMSQAELATWYRALSPVLIRNNRRALFDLPRDFSVEADILRTMSRIASDVNATDPTHHS